MKLLKVINSYKGVFERSETETFRFQVYFLYVWFEDFGNFF